MGEFDVSLEDVFAGGRISEVCYPWRNRVLRPCLLILRRLQTRWFPLKSSRKKAGVSGEVQLTLVLVDTANEVATTPDIYAQWTAFARSFVAQPSPPDSVDEDPLSRELGSSDDDDSSPSPREDDALSVDKTQGAKHKKSKGKGKGHVYQFSSGSDVVGVLFLEISSITDLPPERNGMYPPSRGPVWRG